MQNIWGKLVCYIYYFNQRCKRIDLTLDLVPDEEESRKYMKITFSSTIHLFETFYQNWFIRYIIPIKLQKNGLVLGANEVRDDPEDT